MKLNTNTIIFLYILMSLNFSCKKDKEAIGTDKVLYDMAKQTNGFTWYKNNDMLLDKSSGSGHPQAFLKTRYNTIASSMLDTNGKIALNAAFPEGSLIVKELYSNTSTLDRYAILYKNTSNENADTKGWVWGYINADGSVAESSTNKGESCIGCHSQTGQIDYMLMNKFFP